MTATTHFDGDIINYIIMYKKIFIIIILAAAPCFKGVITYKTALEYCKIKGFHSTGEAVLCHYNFINKIDKNLAEKYLKTRDDCAAYSDNQIEISVCVDKKMLR